MSFQLVIPGGLLSSRARVCFTNRGRLLENDRSKARTIFDPVLVCLNFLSHEWGASHSATIDAQEKGLLDDKDVNVRLAILRNLWHSKETFPEVEQLVKKAARKDASRD